MNILEPFTVDVVADTRASEPGLPNLSEWLTAHQIIPRRGEFFQMPQRSERFKEESELFSRNYQTFRVEYVMYDFESNWISVWVTPDNN